MARVTISEGQEQAIREAHAEGLSQSAVAKRLGISRPAISRWSKRVGLVWTGVPAAAAQQAERIKASRRELSERSLADALAMRERFYEEHQLFFTTTEGVVSRTLGSPDAKALNDIAGAIERMVRTHVHLSGLTQDIETDAATSMLARVQAQMAAYVAGLGDD